MPLEKGLRLFIQTFKNTIHNRSVLFLTVFKYYKLQRTQPSPNEGHGLHPFIHLQQMKNIVSNKNWERGPEEQEREHTDIGI